MPSKTEICNFALIKMGESDYIGNIDQDNSLNARTMKNIWGICRNQLLRDHNWRFAMVRQALVSETAPSSDKWSYSFALPSDPDRMRLIDVPGHQDKAWEIEGEHLYTNMSSVTVRYVSKITDTALYPDDFSNALAAKLAYESVQTVAPDKGMKDRLLNDFVMAIKDAKGNNAIEATPEVYTPRSRMKSWATR